MLSLRFPIPTVTIALAAFQLTACSPPATVETAVSNTTDGNHISARGTLVSVEHLEDKDQGSLQEIADTFPGRIDVSHGATLYRITYWTDIRGEPVLASGLFSMPENGIAPKGVVAYFHGTNASRSLAPSQPDRVDGNEETAIFAGNGYYVALPDYIGLGVSERPQAFLVTKPQVNASIDLLLAAQKAAEGLQRQWPSSLFMMGFSQGGQVVAGVHRELEKNPVAGLDLQASVGVAGPYNLSITTHPKAMANECLVCVGYLAWAASAYSRYYDQSLAEALLPDYEAIVPGLFDGTKSELEIAMQLPEDPAKMFKPRFLDQIRLGQENWFTHALADNETYDWIPVAPIRLYFGEADVDVTPAASRYFYDYSKPRGGNISLHSLGDVDHATSASMSYAPTLLWFDTLSEGD